MHSPESRFFAAIIESSRSFGSGSPVSTWREKPASTSGTPDPVLEHLRRRLDEVASPCACRRSAGARRGRQRLVEDVAELVEERLDLGVAQQRGLRRGRLREVGDDRADRRLVAAVRQRAAADEREGGGVAVLVRPREEVHEEVRDLARRLYASRMR